MDKEKLNRVEELLRAERQQLLSGDFTSKVMGRIRRLPDPELLSPRRDLLYMLRTLSTGEKLGAACVLAGLALLLIPGAGDLIGGLGWELAGMSIDVNVGSSAASASLLSVASIVCCVLLLIGLGAYGARNKLIVT